MFRHERCKALVLLLAEIDQRIAVAVDDVIDPNLPCEKRTFAAEQLAYRRDAALRIEKLLAKLEETQRQ